MSMPGFEQVNSKVVKAYLGQPVIARPAMPSSPPAPIPCCPPLWTGLKRQSPV